MRGTLPLFRPIRHPVEFGAGGRDLTKEVNCYVHHLRQRGA